MRRFRVFVVVMFIGGLLLGVGITPQSTLAASSITVQDNTAYPCTQSGLAGAISDVDADGTVTFNCNPATITFNSQIEITQNVTIDGSNNGSPITLDGNDATRFFYVTSGTLTLQHVTLKNGKTDHGALRIYEDAAAEITDVTFDSNSAFNGGAIFNLGTLTINQSTFTSNEAKFGGAIYSFGILTITQSTFDTNTATFVGGAIQNGGTLTITQSSFSTNSSGSDGGAIESVGDLTTIQRSSFVNNHSGGVGGAIDAWEGSATIIASTLTGNTAIGRIPVGTGSAIYVSEFADGVRIVGSTIVQPENSTPALSITKSDDLTLEGVILAGDGTHCEFVDGDLADSSTLSNDASCNLQGVGSHQSVTNLGLGPLTTATINGVEQTYYPLLQGSPAIDGSLTSACPSPDPNENLDQLGTPRPQSISCDIGAIESSYTGAQILCANKWNGALHYASPCDRSSTPVVIAPDGQLNLCVNQWNSATRVSDRCSRSERQITIFPTQSIQICVDTWTNTIRITDRCTRSETQRWL